MTVYLVVEMSDVIHGVFSTEERAREVFERRKLSDESSSIVPMTVDEATTSEYLYPGTPA